MSYSELDLNTRQCSSVVSASGDCRIRAHTQLQKTSASVYLASLLRDLVASRLRSDLRDVLCIYLSAESFLCICHCGENTSFSRGTDNELVTLSVGKEGSEDYL